MASGHDQRFAAPRDGFEVSVAGAVIDGFRQRGVGIFQVDHIVGDRSIPFCMFNQSCSLRKLDHVLLTHMP